MRPHVLILLVISLFSWSFAQALPQTNLETVLQDKLDTALKQTADAAPVFGSVEALWQFQRRPPRRGFHRARTSYIRTQTTAVISGDLVFFRLTSGFELGGSFIQQPKILELTFTALDGTQVMLEPSYQPLKRRWVFARVKTSTN